MTYIQTCHLTGDREIYRMYIDTDNYKFFKYCTLDEVMYILSTKEGQENEHD